MSLIQIADLTRARVRGSIELALASGADPRVIAELTASIDWTGFEKAPSDIRELLGNLEGWTAEVEEGDIPRAKYRELLENALATSAARVN